MCMFNLDCYFHLFYYYFGLWFTMTISFCTSLCCIGYSSLLNLWVYCLCHKGWLSCCCTTIMALTIVTTAVSSGSGLLYLYPISLVDWSVRSISIRFTICMLYYASGNSIRFTICILHYTIGNSIWFTICMLYYASGNSIRFTICMLYYASGNSIWFTIAMAPSWIISHKKQEVSAECKATGLPG